VGLRGRLILIVTLGLGVSLAASMGVLLRLEEIDERKQASLRAASLMAALAAPVSVLYTQGRVADIDNLVVELDAQKGALGLSHIVLVDGGGAVIAETGELLSAGARFGRRLAESDAFIARAIAARQALQDPDPPAWPQRVSVPVQTGVRWATLVASLDEERVRGQLAERRLRLVASAVAVSSIGLVVLLLLLSLEVIAPIREIVRAAERLAAGDFKSRAPLAGAAEVQTLAVTLNDAARKLGKQQEVLEGLVQKRTEELEMKNDLLARANERLEKLALTDPLTGLPNRRYLEQALAFEVTRQKRHKRPFSLLMLDVDHFKHYNDTHGHPAGDEVLREIARIMANSLRASDVVARVGGEEFVVMLLDTELPLAASAGEKVRAAVEQHEFKHGSSQPGGRLTISAGVASYPMHGGDGDEVLASADRALYRSKAAGRNRVSEPEVPS
jgi:diguanylate cyclase (GGDEF)-like protein